MFTEQTVTTSFVDKLFNTCRIWGCHLCYLSSFVWIGSLQKQWGQRTSPLA